VISRAFIVAVLCPAIVAAACAPAADAPEATPVPRASPEPAIVLRHGDGSRRSVALTFDLGDGAGRTADILAALRIGGVRAAFAVTGRWAEAHPALMRAIAADGHRFLNTTYDGASFTGVSTGAAPLTFDQRSLALSRAETSVYRATNRGTRPYVRPPHGDVDASVERDAVALGYGVVVLWSFDTLGRDGASADAIVERTLSLAQPGAIIAMHAGAESRDADALPRIIEGLRERGYAFESIDEIRGPATGG